MAGAWLTVRVKRLSGVGAARRCGGEGQGVHAAGVGRRGAAEHAGALSLNVTPLGSVPLSLSVGVGKPVAVTVKVPAVPTVKVVLAGAGDGRRLGRLVDGEREGLRGVGAHAVGGGDGQGVDAPGAGRRGAAEHAGAVVVEGHAAGQRAALAQRRGRHAGGRHREAARRAHREGGAVGAGDGRRLVDGEGEGLGGVAAHAVGGGEGQVVGRRPVLAAGVPLSTPVVVLNVTPLGSVPLSLSVGVGTPVAVTVKLPAVPTVKVVLLALVMAGAWVAWLTVRVKVWVAWCPRRWWR